MPPVLMPSGLSAQRSHYLYDKVREYVRDPRKKDDVCPKPSLAINLSSAAENVCAQDQPGPSTAIPGHPLLKVMSLMMKTKAGNADQILVPNVYQELCQLSSTIPSQEEQAQGHNRGV